MAETEPSLHVYLVEDSVAQRDLLAEYLERHGVQVTTMGSAEEMLHRIQRNRPDLVVLDLGLPGIDGLQACMKLRLEGDPLPVIMLTARHDEFDRVMGLEGGADDYLTKPFSARELLARIRAVLRRSTSVPTGSHLDNRSVPVGRWHFLPAERCLRRGDEMRVLNNIEFSLLAELVRNPGRALARERLLAVSHHRRDTVTLRAIDAAVMRLRKLVEPDPASPMFIRTIRGQGYVFVPVQGAEPAAVSPATRTAGRLMNAR